MADNTKCLDWKLTAASPEFRPMKEWYPDKRDSILVNILSCYRDYKELDYDWFPSSPDDHRKITYYINHRYYSDRDKTTESDTSVEQLNDLYDEMLRNFTPTQLEDRISLLARNFHNTVVSEQKRLNQELGLKLSEYDVIERAGGYVGVMNAIFQTYKNYSVQEILEGELN